MLATFLHDQTTTRGILEDKRGRLNFMKTDVWITMK